jgi:hypothetical protein
MRAIERTAWAIFQLCFSKTETGGSGFIFHLPRQLYSTRTKLGSLQLPAVRIFNSRRPFLEFFLLRPILGGGGSSYSLRNNEFITRIQVKIRSNLSDDSILKSQSINCQVLLSEKRLTRPRQRRGGMEGNAKMIYSISLRNTAKTSPRQ